MPGEIICSANQKKAGRGTYQDGNDIKAAIIGKQALIESEVILVSLYNDEDQPELRVGSLILGEVVRIKEDRAILKILKIDNKRFNG
jgi:exosome complex component CSL4